jgi:aryl-alcohol dehydrogenase-like predicted oxidoreductase
MNDMTLARTRLATSVLSPWGIGTHLGATDSQTDVAQENAIYQCVIAGVRVIDTANIYRAGRAEISVGRALQRLASDSGIAREQVFLSTKVGQFVTPDGAPDGIEAYAREELFYTGRATEDDVVRPYFHCLAPNWIEWSVLESLRRLRTDYVDLVYLHCPEVQRDKFDATETYRRIGAAFAALEALRSQRRLKWYGIATMEALLVPESHPRHLSLATVIQAARAAGGNEHGFAAVQAPMNKLMPSFAVERPQRVEDDMVSGAEAAHRFGLARFCSLPLGGGQLADSADDALAFVKKANAFETILVGAKSLGSVATLSKLAGCAPPATRRADPPVRYGFVDFADANHIAGWNFWTTGLGQVNILLDGKPAAGKVFRIPRGDVAAVHQSLAENRIDDCGFSYRLPVQYLEAAPKVVTGVVEFVAPDGTTEWSPNFAIPLGIRSPQDAELSAYRDDFLKKAPAPFPPLVVNLLEQLRGKGAYDGRTWTDSDCADAIEDIRYLARRGDQRLVGFRRYLGQIKAFQRQFEVIEKLFPKANLAVTPDSICAVPRATTIDEMLIIAHHLILTRDYGVSGHLLEFGCFFGFSTCCLSIACHALGFRMDVFDSFEGLPEPDVAGYRKGDFAADLASVRRHVAEFGRVEVVEFHKGFFSDTLKNWKPIDVAGVWMDVDLLSSAKDAMSIVPHMSRQGAVFSNEFAPGEFEEGRLQSAIISAKPDGSVLPAIIDAFAKDARAPAGRYLAGMTGAIWDAHEGIPVLPLTFVHALLSILD